MNVAKLRQEGKMINKISKAFGYFHILIKKNVFVYIIMIFLSLISEMLLLIPPYFNGKIIDNVLVKNFEYIIKYLIISLIIYIFIAFLSLYETYVNEYMIQKMIYKFKIILFERIVCLKMEEFDKKTGGEYLEILDGDTENICSFYINAIPDLIINIIKLIGAGVLSVCLSPVLALIGFLSFPVSLSINSYFSKKMKIVFSKVRKGADELTGFSQQIINGEKTIKGLNIESSILKRYKLKAESCAQMNLNSGMLLAYSGLVQTIVATLFELVIVSLASYLIINGKLTIGSYVAFNVYLSQFLSAIRTLTNTNLNVENVLVSTERINEIYFQEIEEITEEPMLSCSAGEVKITDIEFSYQDEKKVLDKINLNFAPKSITAIVGASGSGKTTILNLFLKFYESDKGNILICGHDINILPLSVLRNLITYVQQESFFLSDTIKNNLNIVNPLATDEEIEDACKKAEIYQKIISLPNGFSTVLRENVTILSSGEKQRLAIARGLLKKAKIFLFDEVTSNLDCDTEKKILRTLTQLGKEYTVIVIAHRLTLIENIPRIVVLDGGKVVGDGNHSYLLSECKEYQRLFKK